MKTTLEQVENALIVRLCSCANPDHGQRGSQSPKVNMPVMDLAEASKACQQYISDWNLGGGNWSGGRVYNHKGRLIARVSYNGRVWDKKGNEISITK